MVGLLTNTPLMRAIHLPTLIDRWIDLATELSELTLAESRQ